MKVSPAPQALASAPGWASVRRGSAAGSAGRCRAPVDVEGDDDVRPAARRDQGAVVRQCPLDPSGGGLEDSEQGRCLGGVGRQDVGSQLRPARRGPRVHDQQRDPRPEPSERGQDRGTDRPEAVVGDEDRVHRARRQDGVERAGGRDLGSRLRWAVGSRVVPRDGLPRRHQPALDRGRPARLGDAVVDGHGGVVQQPPQRRRVVVVTQYGDQLHGCADCGQVGGGVPGSPGSAAAVRELDDGHRAVAAEPPGRAGEPTVEQRVTDHDDPRRAFGDQAGQRGRDGRGGHQGVDGTGWSHRSSSRSAGVRARSRAALASSPGGRSRHSWP